MPEKPPFLEDGSQYGVSRTTFRRMRKAEKRELMIQWFHQNFEDPTNSTPRNDGEFNFIWGGPYDARDELGAKFGDIADEKLIEQVAEEVESEGISDWAPAHGGEDRDDIDLPEEPDLSQLERFSDQPTPAYGSPADQEARTRARDALEKLERAFERPIGIGHNLGPVDGPDELSQIQPVVKDLIVEFAKPNPDVGFVVSRGKRLRNAFVATRNWIAHKLDVGVESAIKAGAAAGAVALVAEYKDALATALNTIIHWLHLVAQLI